MLNKFPKGAIYTTPQIRLATEPSRIPNGNADYCRDLNSDTINKIEITDNITSSGGSGIGNFCYKTVDVELNLKNLDKDAKESLIEKTNNYYKVMYIQLYYLTDYRAFVYDSTCYFTNEGARSNAYPVSVDTDYEYFKSDILELNINSPLSTKYYDWEDLQLGIFYISETTYDKNSEKLKIKGQIVPNDFDDILFTVAGATPADLQSIDNGLQVFNSLTEASANGKAIKAWGRMPSRLVDSRFSIGSNNSKNVTAREWIANLAIIASGNVRHKRIASLKDKNRFVIARFGTNTILGATSTTEGDWIAEQTTTLPWDKVIKFEDGDYPNEDLTNSANYILPTLKTTGAEKRRLTIVGGNSENGMLQFNNRLWTRDNLDPNDSNHPNFKKIIRPGLLSDGTSYVQKFRSFSLECDGLPHVDAGDTLYLLKEGTFRGETADTTGYTNCYKPLHIGQHIFTYDCGKCTSKMSGVIPKNMDTIGIDIQEKT